MKPIKIILLLFMFILITLTTACQSDEDTSTDFLTVTPVSESLILTGKQKPQMSGVIAEIAQVEGQPPHALLLNVTQDSLYKPSLTKMSVGIVDFTRIFIEKDGEYQIISADELVLGMNVEVLFTGVIFEGYPVHGNASEIVVMETPNISLATATLSITPTPRPSATATLTPAPTATAKVLLVTPSPNEPECARPDDLSDLGINVSVEPFCVVWVDKFEDEVGFQIILDYAQSDEHFIYESEPNITQLIVPFSDAPRLNESREQCLGRKDWQIQVIALRPSAEYPVGSTAVNLECGAPDNLPTATPSP